MSAMDQTLIDFMNRPDFDELSVWSDGISWVAIAATGIDDDYVHARVTLTTTNPVQALLAAVARHKVMEGGNG